MATLLVAASNPTDRNFSREYVSPAECIAKVHAASHLYGQYEYIRNEPDDRSEKTRSYST